VVTQRKREKQRLWSFGNIAWLTPLQLLRLERALVVATVVKGGIIFDGQQRSDLAYILLSGIARITCQNRKRQRSLVMMVPIGLIPALPPSMDGIRCQFRCEALTDCEVGMVGLESFFEISLGIDSTQFRHMTASWAGGWDRARLRSSDLMSCTLDERLALALLELAEHFGVPDKFGIRLTVELRHQDLADLVGASRPRVTERIIKFERNRLIVRERRSLVIRFERLTDFLAKTQF
jgi:CRP/FNR family transcriptional regulator, cyclic AMP receptor protein